MPGVLLRNSARSNVLWRRRALGVPLWLLLAGAAVAADPVPASTAADAGLAARVAALEQRLASMEDEAPRTQGRVSVNGFMSAGVAQVLDDRYRYDVDTVGPEASFRPDSMLGVQLDMTVNEQVRAITQLVGRGSEDFDARMEWAFLQWRAHRDHQLRIGRLRLPFFMMSEYLEVGYTYPWARPPIDVYRAYTPSSWEAASWEWTLAAGSWTHEVQWAAGTFDFNYAGGGFHADDVVSVTWYGTWHDLTLRLGYLAGNATYSSTSLDAANVAFAGALTPVLLDKQGEGEFKGAGFQYDNGSLLVMGEANQVDVKGFYRDSVTGYVTAGWHLGKWLPHVTWAGQDTTDKWVRRQALPPALRAADPLNRLLATDQQSVAIGLRYDPLPNLALKLDVTRIVDTDDGWGSLSPAAGSKLVAPVPDQDVDTVRFVVDAVF